MVDQNKKPGMFYACVFSSSSNKSFAISIAGRLSKKVRGLNLKSQKKKKSPKKQEDKKRSYPNEATPSKPLR